MNPQLIDILESPDDHSPLSYDEQLHVLVSASAKHHYKIEKNVPVLLIKEAQESHRESTHHHKQDSKFYYVDHYQKDAEHFNYFEAFTDPATVHENRRLHEVITSEVPKSAKTILDVGCGNAWVAAHFCPKGASVYSFDISTTNTVKAIQKYPFENHFAITGDVYALPIKENSFDCVISAEVIEHVPDLMAYIKNLLRVVKPGGSIIITTPYNEQISYSLCIHCNKLTPQHAHIHSFNEEKVKDLLSRFGNIEFGMYTFSSKMLAKLKTHIFLKHLPFKFWRFIDALANKLYKKPYRLLISIHKE